ncbi:MAG TPA: serine hydrolase domain-containing protein [Acidobacteriaceae bacterium]|nr:serine hydrolase domain-containing protein [Acidobacteriaceae bacterium]
MTAHRKCLPLVLVFCTLPLVAQQTGLDASIDAYVKPYVDTNNFSGAILVERDGKVLLQKAYGFADREHRVDNTLKTRFHVASISMQFTAAAVLRLADRRQLSLDDTIGDVLPGIPGANRITIRDLLTERSGLPDINSFADYNEVLQKHQTPASLVAKINGKPLLFPPGSQFLHEEHSAYNLLALIVEQKTGLPFAAAMHNLVFQPATLNGSFIDDDSPLDITDRAIGYQPAGVSDLQPATQIHWSAKSGNASVCTTVGDEARWVDALFNGSLLTAASRTAVLENPQNIGYGWFRANKERFSETAYYMNGRAPGFASFVLYLPRERLTVVAFSNIYSSATTTIGYDIAAIALALPYDTFTAASPLTSAAIAGSTGTFQFGPDFYQRNAKLELISASGGLALHWPSGDLSPLIPQSSDHFIDRSYWENVSIERDAAGHAVALNYDRFRGPVVPTP